MREPLLICRSMNGFLAGPFRLVFPAISLASGEVEVEMSKRRFEIKGSLFSSVNNGSQKMQKMDPRHCTIFSHVNDMVNPGKNHDCVKPVYMKRPPSQPRQT